jgi:hypothetical protein
MPGTANNRKFAVSNLDIQPAFRPLPASAGRLDEQRISIIAANPADIHIDR